MQESVSRASVSSNVSTESKIQPLFFKRVFTQSLADPSRVIIAKRLCWQARDWLPVWVAQLLTSIQFLSTIIKMSSLSCVMLFAEQCMNLPPKLQSFHVCAREVA